MEDLVSATSRAAAAALVLLSLIPMALGNAAADVPAALRHPISELTPVARIHLGKTADWVAMTDDAVWVATTGPEGVAQIDPRSNTVTAAIALPGEACAGLAVSRDSVWLVVDGRSTLARIDPSALRITERIPVPQGSLNVTYGDGFLWVTRPTGAQVTIVDADKDRVIGTVPTGPKPRFLDAGAGSVWTLNQGDGTLTRISTQSKRAAGTSSLRTPGHGGDIKFAHGIVWTTMLK